MFLTQNKPIQSTCPLSFDDTPIAMDSDQLAHVVESISDEDQAWFAAHPGEEFHIRDYVPGELQGYTPSSMCRVLVQRLPFGQAVRCTLPPEIWRSLEEYTHAFD